MHTHKVQNRMYRSLNQTYAHSKETTTRQLTLNTLSRFWYSHCKQHKLFCIVTVHLST